MSFGRLAVFGAMLASAVAYAAAPLAFTYVVRSGVATNVTVTSEAKTVTGFTGELPVSVSGGIAPQYKVGSGAFTSAPGTIAAGQTLTVRHTSSSSSNTESTTTVTVGDYSTPFKSVTGATDRTPDAFTFGEILNTPPNSFVESPVLTLTGFNTGVPVVAGSGAQYRIDGGSWTNVSGTLNPNQTIQARHLTSSGELAYTKTSIRVGGIDGTFTTRNRSNVNVAPTANAGADQLVDENTEVTLDGSASADDGVLTYAWTQTGGTAVVLSGADTATPRFTAPDVSGDETLSFELTVTDDRGATATDSVDITVLPVPVMSISDGQGLEGTGLVGFQVTFTPATPRGVIVDFHTSDVTARSPRDYDGNGANPGQFAVPPGTSEATLYVQVVDDTFDENDETFTLGLSNARGATIGNGLATGTITDDDDKGLLRVGAAKRSITPSRAHVDGQAESYAGGTRLQRFHLGGFGLGPFKVVPAYGGVTPPFDVTQAGANPPAGAACYAPALIADDAANVRPEDCTDHSWVRVMVVEERDGDRVAFVIVDAVGAGNLVVNAVKAEVERVSCALGACIAPANILVGHTHSHAGADLQGLWGGVPREWIAQVLARGAGEAAGEAITARVPSNLTMARGYDDRFNNYRRPKVRGDEEVDTAITLLVARADGGDVVGSIVTYAAHPTAIGDDTFCHERNGDGDCVRFTRVPHPDYPLGATDDLESELGGTALYFNGPIADASGSGPTSGANPYEHVKSRGRQVAQRARAFLAASGVPLDPVLATAHADVILPITNPAFVALGLAGVFNGYYQFTELPRDQIPGLDALDPQVEQVEQARNQLPQVTPIARTLVSRISLGTSDPTDPAKNRLEIVTIPGESTNTFGQYIRRLAREDAPSVAAPDTHTMLLGLTQSSFGYIIPEEEFGAFEPPLPTEAPYEETVSLGPLTAPLLRSEGYIPLFAADPAEHVPQHVQACAEDPESIDCTLGRLLTQVGLGGGGSVLDPVLEGVDDLLDMIAEGCHEYFPFAEACVATDTLAGLLDGGVPGGDGATPDLLFAAADAAARGCDILDPSNCLYPFPNDHFTVDAAPGSPQAAGQGGTGRRVNLSILATPRNSAGKPVDPTEWNRQDGFSPGALITTYVPGLSLEQTFGLPSHEIGLANLALSQDPASPILVLEVGDGEPVRHLVWAEIDQNANQLTNVAAPSFGALAVPGATDSRGHVSRPLDDGKAALLIRPAKNFAEGKRYVVVLRNLKDAAGNPIAPQAGFRACLAGDSTLLPVQQRCAKLEDDVFPVLDDAGIDRDDVFLAWDFTVQSTNNAIGRLRHMRDDAFASLSRDPADEDCTQLTAANAATCAAPGIRVVNVQANPQTGIARRIEGTITVPSYLAPFEPAPGDDAAASGAIHAICDNAGPGEGDCRGDFRDGADSAQGLTASSRLFYNPADRPNPEDPAGQRWGDGLPDSTGSMEARFLCQISAQATPDTPARASLYGHGQLDKGVAITYEGVPEQTRNHNYMFCAVDWFGFRFGDIPNVATTLVDLSNFPVIPDASQQGMLNMMFLARAMQHPRGFGALPEFQDAASGRPLFDRSEIFYDGNSQGGIFGGVVLAASKDVNRGVLGALGMNYSTLLTRSANFDEYAGVLYTAYTDPLDRQLLFSMMQMLWDRSENDGYASHLHDNAAFGGPKNDVMLAPAFGDPQVSMWTADVMARTMGGVPVDAQQTLHVERLGTEPAAPNGRRHPDVAPYYGLAAMDFANPAHTGGSVLQVWDNNQLKGKFAFVPPTTNTPPYATKEDNRDPHDTSQRTDDGRCVHAHFMRTGGQVIDAMPLVYGTASCPPIPPATPTVRPDDEPAPVGLADALGAALDRFAEALATIPDHLAAGEVVAALDAVIGGTQQVVADAGTAIAVQLGNAAGVGLAPPGAGSDPVPHAPEPLMAGAAKRAIAVPVGTPLGGYLRPPVGGEYIGDDPAGEITDNVPSANDSCDPTAPESCIPNAPLPDEARKAHSPYATYSPPSRGYYDSLVAKAVALYDGRDYVVMVKSDFIGMLDEVVQDVKADVKDRTGIDLGDGLIMSATHTHGGPGALANHSTRYFWLAMDLYQPDVYRKLIGQFADVVVAALHDLQPARIGHGNGLDSPQAGNGHGLNGYRRGRLDTYDDDDRAGCAFVPAEQCPAGLDDANELRKRIGVLRVDSAATGAPIAVVINFADHGIAFDVENQYFSGDVLASIEREVEQSYVKPAGDAAFRAPIAMLVQNTGGDVTPKNVEYSIRGIEMLGKRMAPQVRAIADPIANFQAAPDLRAVSQRIILNRERLGYAEDEYPYPWGAAQCGNDLAVPFADVGVSDIPGYNETGLPRKHLYCIPATPPDAADLADNGVAENAAFVPGDTILTAAKIGDITLLVQPGEPLTEYGVRSLEMAQAEGFAPADTFIWGYSADHIGYILPAEKEDWATFGGAESTTTFWGWKQGERFINGHRELLRALRDGKAAPADEFELDYSLGKAMAESTPAAVPTPSLLAGAIVAEPADIARFGKTVFTFEGGDPVLDLPHVTMLHADGSPVRRANGEVIDTFFEMHLKYRLVSGRHLWTVEFEAPKDWAAGAYRFQVSGKAEQGGTIDYALESANFAVTPATNLAASGLACAAGRCAVRVGYAPVPSNYRIVDANVAPNQSAPMRTGSVTFTNGTDSVTVAGDGNGNFSAAIGGAVTVSAIDAWGNTTPPASGPAPDTDGDGVADDVDECPTEAGPASNNGCPAGNEPPPFPFNPCAPDQVPGIGGECFLDIPVLGDALETAWETLNGGGGGEPPALPGGETVQPVVEQAVANAQTLPADLQASVETLAGNAATGQVVDRDAEAIVLEGRSFPDWSQPAAQGIAMPYPNGAFTGERDAHAGVMLYPQAGFTGLPTAAPVREIVAFKRVNDAWEEIPVQVDERFPYFLANPNSEFGMYSGTDMELTYAWDRELWKATGACFIDPLSVQPTPDPVPGLDDDDEIAFMWRDAGDFADPTVAGPEGTVGGGQEIALADPLDPSVQKFVYLFRKPEGPTFSLYYVDYARDENADQWIDRSFFEGGPDTQPYKRNALGTSNTGYGPNLSGSVCWDGATPRPSTDRFPRDGVTISTDKYQLYASGRWMVRDVKVAKPDQPRVYGADIVDRWKGRAFQQSPDSTISLVGFEDEQVNWEANSALLGERVGPVRAIREVWGADSGTNVTKTETYYADAYTYRYRMRVHPIPPDGIYTSWDYNRGAMVPAAGDDPAKFGRYYTAVRGAGVPIDGINDDVGNVDGVGGMPAYADIADPTLNLPLAMYNWEQVAAKNDLGSLVYLFELKSPTIGANAAIIPYYRDDACLDDGTGDDPVQRPWPGEASTDSRVVSAYSELAGGTPYAQLRCDQKQGAHAQHGIHMLFPPETDNATAPVPVNEVDGQQWAFPVPMSEPTNVGERYANIVRAPVLRVARPRPAADAGGGDETGSTERGLVEVASDFVASLAGDPLAAFNDFVAGVAGLVFGNDHASVVAVAADLVNSPGDAADDAGEASSVLLGYAGNGRGKVFAGVGVVDMTPDVGYGAGQYTGSGPTTYGYDPYLTGKKQRKSYGVMTRLTARAIVLEGANGKRIALLKSDNYLAQDLLMRRVAQILEEQNSSIGYDQILYGVTHAHSSSYYSGSPAVAAFQDVMDPRFFEDQARKLAEAIVIAERSMQPARLGATTVRHKVFKGQIMGPAVADDGTPAAYPNEYGDLGLVVMRIETDEAQPRPIAVWVNWGEHPEGLDGYDLHSGDFVAYLERFVERDLKAPLVFSQGDVGSAEKSGNENQRIADDGTVCQTGNTAGTCAEGEGTWRDWNHKGYVQNERNVRFLADAVVKGWQVIGGERLPDAAVPDGAVKPNNYVPEVQVALSNDFPVDYRNAFVPGPVSHPYPAVSNCRSEPTVGGNVGVAPGLPDCIRGGFPGSNPVSSQLAMIVATLRAEGVPVPDHYDAPAFVALEDNARLKLQAFRIGDIVLGSCACEAQVDLILNFESRANDVPNDIYDGFDWACVAEDKGSVAPDAAHAAACAIQRAKYYDVREFPVTVPGSLADVAKVARMRAQVHNDARGWDAPEYAPYANAEPVKPADIKGNFTKEELPAGRGYKIAVGLGHAGDYNGYTVSYREYMNRDHYRKALTAYGPHTADYMVTRLVRMAGAMKGGPELAPEPQDTTAQADEARMVAQSRAIGVTTRAAYEAWFGALPPDAGPAAALAQPADTGLFRAAAFTWRGGSTQVDNPRVVVERRDGADWKFFADQTGEVQTRVQWPQGPQGVATTYAGQQEWRWTANFEAYESFPARLGGTPPGEYRFVVQGCINDFSAPQANLANRAMNFLASFLPRDLTAMAGLSGNGCRGGASPYELESAPFDVFGERELVTAVTADANGDLAITIAPTSIPKSYANTSFPYVRPANGPAQDGDPNDNGRFCMECSFRPWATSTSPADAVWVTVNGNTIAATGSGAAWNANVDLAPGATATIVATYADGQVSRPYAFTR